MQITRHLANERIRMEMHTRPLPAEEAEELGDRALKVLKERILGEVVEFLAETADVGNAKKLRTDLIHRERKACTAVGRGLAIPHVRTQNVKGPTVAFLRSTEGLDFGAPDGQPVHVFLVLLAPPWDDKLYLKIYREAAELFLRDDVLPYLLSAETENDVLNFFRHPERYFWE
ncbi:MAG: PTS sugar transporter subunit IIA [Planctomycetota bacterium JB042]